MKKIQLFLSILLCLFLVSACVDDDTKTNNTQEWNGNWNDPADPNYVPSGYNPIVGDWIITTKDGSPFTGFVVNRFTDTYTWLRATQEPKVGEYPSYTALSSYIINDKAFRDPNNEYGLTIKYTLTAGRRTLTLDDGISKYTMEQYSINDWGGDWNDPANPNYPQHQGKYNPIQGDWKMQTSQGEAFDNHILYRFSSNFQFSQSASYPTLGKDFSFIPLGTYKINDKAFNSKNTIFTYSLSSNFVTGLVSLTITQNSPEGKSVMQFQAFNTAAWKQWLGNFNNPLDPNYVPSGYNPVVGEWMLLSINDKAQTTDKQTIYTFGSDFTSQQLIKDPISNKLLSSKTVTYIINNKAYCDMTSQVLHPFALTGSGSNQRLDIYHEYVKWTFVPYDNWTWHGDWNDPTNPNYVPSGYNPLKGTWDYSDGSNAESNGWTFDDNLMLVDRTPITPTTTPIQINDTGVAINANGTTEYFKYTIATNHIEGEDFIEARLVSVSNSSRQIKLTRLKETRRKKY